MVELLTEVDRAEALDVLTEAFADHPMMSLGGKTGRLLELLLDTFERSETSRLFGIRRDGRIVCVSFCVDADFDPPLRALPAFLLGLLRLLGWRWTIEFTRTFSRRQRYEEPYLELMLLGTRPDCHGQGCGRSMLRFLYEFAKEQEYHGLILQVAKDTPAHRLYLKEGFVLDGEALLHDTCLCHMRRDSVSP